VRPGPDRETKEQAPNKEVGMKKKMSIAVAVVLAGAALAARAFSQGQGDPLDPLRAAADTHKLALENKFVRVLDVHIPPGKVEPRHRHPHGLSVYFTDWDVKVTPDGGPGEVHHRKAGTFQWSEAVTHTVENVGQTEGHVLRIELKF
jgi:quercetin dioxygenase-like cupin family protein